MTMSSAIPRTPRLLFAVPLAFVIASARPAVAQAPASPPSPSQDASSSRPAPAKSDPAVSSASAAQDAKARGLYRKGSAAYEAGDYSGARKALLEAWNIKRTYDVAGALAQVEIELKLDRDAAEHLDYCVRNYPASESDQRLETLRKELDRLKARLTTVQLRVEPDGVDVFVDGRVVATSPLASPIFLTAGDHRIEARRGGESVSRPVRAVPGVEQSIVLSLTSVTPSAATPPPAGALGSPSPIPSPSGASPGASSHAAPVDYQHPSSAPALSLEPPATGAKRRDHLIPVYIGAGLAVVGAGAAIGFGLAAESDRDRLDALSWRNGPNGCTSGSASAAECAEQRDLAQSADRKRNLSTAGIVVGGIGVAFAAVGYLLWPRTKDTSATARPTIHITGSLTGPVQLSFISSY